MNDEKILTLCRAFPGLYLRGIPEDECEQRSKSTFLNGPAKLVMGRAVDGNPLMISMQWGFEVGDGWFDLIHSLSSDITALAQQYGLHPYVTQVKEKFGGMRFHLQFREEVVVKRIKECGIDPETGKWENGESEYRPGWQEIRARVREATEASMKICEKCGAPGILIREGWHHVHCRKCEEALRTEKGGRL